MAKVPIPDRPGTNWVEKTNALGGKGNWIRRAAEHLIGKGMPTSQAIATAINAAKKMCATGDTNWPGLQQVNPGSQAQACAAVAEWEAGKARARLMSIPANERRVVELAFRKVEEAMVELSWVHDGPTIELAAPRAGLVPVKVKVTNRKGTTFERTMYVRPNQAKSLQEGKGAAKVSKAGADVTKATRSVLEELAKVPRDQRPAGWQDAVKALADFRHGGRLGPEKRRALRDLQEAAPDGSPLKAAVTNALKTDAAPVKKAEARAKRTAEKRAGGKKPNRPRQPAPFTIASRSSDRRRRVEKKAGGRKPNRPRQAPYTIDASVSASERERLAADRKALPGGRFPIRNRADLENAIRAIGRAKPGDRDRIKAFIKRRARQLDATDAIPAGW